MPFTLLYTLRTFLACSIYSVDYPSSRWISRRLFVASRTEPLQTCCGMSRASNHMIDLRTLTSLPMRLGSTCVAAPCLATLPRRRDLSCQGGLPNHPFRFPSRSHCPVLPYVHLPILRPPRSLFTFQTTGLCSHCTSTRLPPLFSIQISHPPPPTPSHSARGYKYPHCGPSISSPRMYEGTPCSDSYLFSDGLHACATVTHSSAG